MHPTNHRLIEISKGVNVHGGHVGLMDALNWLEYDSLKEWASTNLMLNTPPGLQSADRTILLQKREVRKAQIAKLEAEIIGLHLDVVRNTAILAPIRVLPSEILARIFVQLAQDVWNQSTDRTSHSRSRRINPRNQFPKSANTLLAVCQTWRETVLTTPEFWAFIRISQTYQVASKKVIQNFAHELCLGRSLALSKQAPLFVVLDHIVAEGAGDIAAKLTTLQTQLVRCISLEDRHNGAILFNNAIKKGVDLSRLQSLRLHWGHESSHDLYTNLGPLNLPNLVNLDVTPHCIHCLPQFLCPNALSFLLSLHCKQPHLHTCGTQTMLRLLEFSSDMPVLERIVLSHYSVEDWATPYGVQGHEPVVKSFTAIPFASLKELEIDGFPGLCSAILKGSKSSVVKLSLRNIITAYTPDLDTGFPDTLATLPNLMELTIGTMQENVDRDVHKWFGRLLQSTPNLRMLKLQYLGWPEADPTSVIPDFTSCILHVLTERPVGNAHIFIYCPLLEHLTFATHDISSTSILDFIKARGPPLSSSSSETEVVKSLVCKVTLSQCRVQDGYTVPSAQNLEAPTCWRNVTVRVSRLSDLEAAFQKPKEALLLPLPANNMIWM